MAVSLRWRHHQRRVAAAVLACALVASLAACSSSVPALPKLPGDAIIVSFGDSLTWGTGAQAEQSYPAVLARLTGRRVINAGVPGEVTQQGLARLPAILDEHRPQLLILCHGGNDMLRRQSLTHAADNVRRMIRLAKERGIAVVLVGVPKPGLFPSSADFYQQIATESGVPYEGEILADIEAERALKSDAIHPNGDGYRHLAEAIFRLLEKAGAV